MTTATHNPDPIPADTTTGSATTSTIEGVQFYVIGLGGIAEALVRHLGLFLYAVDQRSQVWLVDGDRFGAADKPKGRMGFVELGHKAHERQRAMAQLVGDRVTFHSVPLFVTRENIEELIPRDQPAAIFLCVDNHATRRLVAEYCASRATGLTLLISGGNTSVEEDGGYRGNVQVHCREDARDLTNSILAHHPEIVAADEAMAPKNGVPACTELALEPAGSQIGFTNLAVASAMLNAFHAWYTGRLAYDEVYLDIAENRMVPRARQVLAPLKEAET